MINAILVNICLVLGLLIGVPFLFIYLLSAINRNTKQQIANHFGTAGQIGFGFLGVIIHEASHLLMALVFGHHIDQFRLIRIPTSDNPALGYVHHTWNQRNFRACKIHNSRSLPIAHCHGPAVIQSNKLYRTRIQLGLNASLSRHRS